MSVSTAHRETTLRNATIAYADDTKKYQSDLQEGVSVDILNSDADHILVDEKNFKNNTDALMNHGFTDADVQGLVGDDLANQGYPRNYLDPGVADSSSTPQS